MNPVQTQEVRDKEEVVKIVAKFGWGLVRACGKHVMAIDSVGRVWWIAGYKENSPDLWTLALWALQKEQARHALPGEISSMLEHETMTLPRTARFMVIMFYAKLKKCVFQRGDMLLAIDDRGEEEIVVSPTDAEASIMWEYAFRKLSQSGEFGPTEFLRVYQVF